MLTETLKLTTKEAVVYVLSKYKLSKYRLAQSLGRRPIMVDNYLNKTRMSEETADTFRELYNIEITDAYSRGKAEGVDQ